MWRDDHATISAFMSDFVPHFAPGGVLCGELGNPGLPPNLGVLRGMPDEMPDALLYDSAQDRLVIVDFETRHGIIDEKRMHTLAALFTAIPAHRVYVSVFRSRSSMAKCMQSPAWGSHAWFIDEPKHMIHFW